MPRKWAAYRQANVVEGHGHPGGLIRREQMLLWHVDRGTCAAAQAAAAASVAAGATAGAKEFQQVSCCPWRDAAAPAPRPETQANTPQ